MTDTNDAQRKSAQRTALILAGVGIIWIVATWAGGQFGWSNRIRALFDLAALAGFGFALFKTYQLWRSRQ